MYWKERSDAQKIEREKREMIQKEMMVEKKEGCHFLNGENETLGEVALEWKQRDEDQIR